MDQDQAEHQRFRESSLSIMLAALGLFGFLFFLAVVTGGFFLWVYLIVAAMAIFAYFNYLLWGRSMMDRTAGEREEEEAQSESSDGWAEGDPRRSRHE